ncbi:MAG: tRNA (N6-isopentenyl adenosine(37)-C2)-methylthiotransferase MiaB [Chitinophagales bacterium]|nr:tRNA (N6-isopentenyl adenosine(37)-C2)-methylthiotransferase MiaB [Chitinophagales bacterium]
MSDQLYNNEIAFELGSKDIDESKQGNALTLERPSNVAPNGKKFYIESYGCAMNFSDSEVVASILANSGFDSTDNHLDADLILINTCAIRDNAEQRVRMRLQNLGAVKKKKKGALIGVLGCMAERLKDQFLEQEKLVDIVVGPDAYRSLPELVFEAENNNKAVNVLLSREETYAEISPIRLNSNGISAFISIMRGCDNICSFCVVPFTRGRERSRDWRSIVQEAKDLFDRGYKEVTLLGQNVDSYRFSDDPKLVGKKLLEAKYEDHVVNFAELLEKVASISPLLRIRFSTSHPKDMTDDVLEVMAKYPNVCKHIHLPVQSGNDRILGLMDRSYTKAWYLDRIAAIHRIVPDADISTDIITGFCSETEEEHQETMELMSTVRFDLAYMYYYSERPGTPAAKRLKDDVPEDIKKRRLTEIVALFRQISLERNQENVGQVYEVLLEGISSKSDKHFFGRNSQNKGVIVPALEGMKPGDYVNVRIASCTSGTLIAEHI